MRNPNGYGCIKHLSGRRRRPFVFVVTDAGRQRPVEYFTNLVDAQIFQADYHRTHHHRSLPGHKITLAELYHRWLPRHSEDTQPSQSTLDSYRNAYQHLSTLHGMSIEDLRYADYQRVIDDMRRHGLSYSSLNTQTKSSWLQPTTRRCSLSDAIDRSGRIIRSAGRKSTNYGARSTSPAWIRYSSCSTRACAVVSCYNYKKLTFIFVNAISASHGAKPPPASALSPYITASHRSSSPA